MIRFFYVIIVNFVFEVYYVSKMNLMIRFPHKFTDMQRYKTVQHVLKIIMYTGNIRCKAFGVENIPSEGGYVMFPNHQGKFDALAIVYSHKAPCSLVMDANKIGNILIKDIMAMVNGLGMKIDDVRQSLGVIKEMSERVKAGEAFIIFPEGGYTNNHNHMREFKPGSFKSAVLAKCPIVPVALVDTYRAFNQINFGTINTQVHYLKPIPYEEYQGMNTQQIAAMVKQRIEDTLSVYRPIKHL